jgi:hypothetical protein
MSVIFDIFSVKRFRVMLTLHHAVIRYVFTASSGKAMLLQQLTEPHDVYINQSIFSFQSPVL